MPVLTSKDGDLLACFDKIKENTINNTSLKELLLDNHTTPANKGQMFGILRIEHFFEFCKTFKKITKGLAFHLTFKTTDSENLVHTTLLAATVINVHSNSSPSLCTNDITISRNTIKFQKLYQKKFHFID